MRCFVCLARYLRWRLVEWSPSNRKRLKAGARFDRELGVETCRTRSTEWSGDIHGPGFANGFGYDPAPPDSVREAIARVPSSYQDLTFIDVGSGKGRTLLLAAEFDFQRVIGVEYDFALHTIAQQNVDTCVQWNVKFAKIECHWVTAALFSLPLDPLVIFFHHPAGGATLRFFVENLGKRVMDHDEPVYLIYYDPIDPQVFEAIGLQEIDHCPLTGAGLRNRIGKEYAVFGKG